MLFKMFWGMVYGNMERHIFFSNLSVDALSHLQEPISSYRYYQ